MTAETKTCTACGLVKSVEDFTRRKNAKGEFTLRQPRCKRCRQAAQNAYRSRSPEVTKAANKRNNDKRRPAQQAWAEANRESRRASSKKWREANREKQRKASREWARQNPERHAENYRRWAAENKARRNDQHTERKVRMLGNGTKPYDRRAVFERDEGTCWLCHEPIDWALSGWDRWGFTIDHVVPISKGGIDTFENVKSAHRSCNSRRGNRVTIVKRREVTSAN